jgi:hypothetical protein
MLAEAGVVGLVRLLVIMLGSGGSILLAMFDMSCHFLLQCDGLMGTRLPLT